MFEENSDGSGKSVDKTFHSQHNRFEVLDKS